MKVATLAFLAMSILAFSTVSASAAVTIGGLRYSISDVHVASSIGPDGMETQASGEYLILNLRVSNIGDRAATISSSDFHLRRGQTMFDAASESLEVGGFFLQTLNPGTTRSGLVVFDVPANTSPEKYELQVFGNGGTDPTYIRL